MSTQLVNWKPDEQRFIYIRSEPGDTKKFTQTAFLKRLAKSSRPKEIEDLVNALSDMWKRIGASANCGKCFQGKFHRPVATHGCCGGCPNLGETGCVAKPVGCALYTCHTLHFDGFTKTSTAFIEGQLKMIADFAWSCGLMSGYFSEAYFDECEKKWTAKQLSAAKQLREMVEHVTSPFYQ